MSTVRKTTALCMLACAAPVLANIPPSAPIITEPATDGQVVNPADVHMETGPFVDADPGDTHRCTDWEIWTVSPSQRVWLTACIGGVERLHTHMGDGTFMGSHAGRSEFLPDTDYILRVRHRDSSNDPATEWSGFSQRAFHTGGASAVFPLELEDVAVSPTPQWLTASGGPVTLPAGASPPNLRLDSATGGLLVEFRADGGGPYQVINPPALAGHADVRVRLDSGSAPDGLALPDTRILFTDTHGNDLVIHLPPVNLPAAMQAFFWISANGSSYVGAAEQTEPDFSTLARGIPVPWAVRQPGFQVEIVATGFQLPVNIGFIPNPGPDADSPLYYVTELYGTIKAIGRDGVVRDFATDLLNFDPTGNFPGSGEQGLTGIVVDPASGDVFAAYLYDSATNPGTHYPKVVRFHSNDGGRTAASSTTIRDMVGESQGQSHQISNLTIGPDQKLYVHMGDGFNAGTAQNLNSYRGKILRMNLDGTAPPDNPFYNAGDGITARDYVYAYGFRNPFGGVWRDADARHYEVENGPSVDRMVQVIPGRNYLWDGSDASMANFAIYNWSPATAPVNIVFIQPSVFAGSGFPAAKLDHAFVSESGPTYATGPQNNGKRITEFVLDQNGNRMSGPVTLVEYIGSGKATVTALAAGPDGLYFGDLYKDLNHQTPIDRGANILRVKFVGTADFIADVTTGDAPLAVQFSDQSNVPGASQWSWNFGDGATSSLQNPTHTYTVDGIYDVRLTVTGTSGVSVIQKPAFIRVGPVFRIAMICGAVPPSAADQAIADYLNDLGMVVATYDDDPGNRPTAAALAAMSDLIVVSSSIASGNVAGEFRNQPVPLIHWENALNRVEREPLASDGLTVGGQSAIRIAEIEHPILHDMPVGLVPVFNSPVTLSLATGTIAPGAVALATREGFPGQPAILAADTGALLLNGAIAPAKRVFFFLEDNSWPATNETGRRLFRQAVEWALARPVVYAKADFDRDQDVDLDDFGHLQRCLTGFGEAVVDAGCLDARLDADSDIDATDVQLFEQCLSGANVAPEEDCLEP